MLTEAEIARIDRSCAWAVAEPTRRDVRQTLEEIHFGLVVYENEPVPSSLPDGEGFMERMFTDGLLYWQHVIWASKRIAKLTVAGKAALS